MPRFGRTSNARLNTAHPDLQRLFREVVKTFDCRVIFGHRSVAEQQELYAQGRTEPGQIVTNIDGVTRLSMHNHSPSLAVDVVPYPVNWSDTNRMRYFAGWVMCKAQDMGIPLRWGGDWDSDTDLSDQTFIDLPHFELVGE